MPRTLRSSFNVPVAPAPYVKPTSPAKQIIAKKKKTPGQIVPVPTVEQIISNPSRYFILVDSRLNVRFGLSEIAARLLPKEPYRTIVFAIDREVNGLPPQYIDKFEATLRSKYVAGLIEDDDDEEYTQELPAPIRRSMQSFLWQLATQIYDLSHGRSVAEQECKGIFVSTAGTVVAQLIELSKKKENRVHCIATVDADPMQIDYWNFRYAEAPLRMPLPFDHDDISKAAVATGCW